MANARASADFSADIGPGSVGNRRKSTICRLRALRGVRQKARPTDQAAARWFFACQPKLSIAPSF